jgi:hypothetical protein
MTASNPFDFSDFGPPRRPSDRSPLPPESGKQPPTGSTLSTGFDPWADAPKSSSRRGNQDAFGPSDGASSHTALSTAGPPLAWFAVALALAAAGSTLALRSAVAGAGLPSALLGWLLAGPIAIGALALYTRVDTRRRATSIYSAPRWTSTLYWVVVGVCLIGIALSAWQIALWAGRQ